MQDQDWTGSIWMSLGTVALLAGVAAVPLILRLTDTFARNGGSIAVPGGFSLSIAAAHQVASTRIDPASDEAWISQVWCSTAPYTAATARDEYRTLVALDRTSGALLASVVAPGIDCATAIAPCNCPPQ